VTVARRALHLVCSNCSSQPRDSTVAPWASVASGIATVVLALATWRAAAHTKKAATSTADAVKAADDEAKATLELVKLGREQLGRNYLPVVMPSGIGIETDTQRAVTLLTVDLENVGLGPALGLAVEVLFQGLMPPNPERRRAVRPAMGAGGRGELVLEYQGYVWEGNDADVTVTFRDVFQNHYAMRCHFIGGDRGETTLVVLDATTPEGSRIQRLIGDDG